MMLTRCGVFLLAVTMFGLYAQEGPPPGKPSLRERAAKGDPFAQASLALLYRFGKGVPQDYVQSYMWFQLSVDQLTGADRDSIVELRDAAAAHMTPQQIADARRLAHDWKAKKNQ
jgi:TPR repeat protein